MKKTLTYILASMILCLLHSCVLDEAYEPTTDDLPAGPITFTATPKGYVQKPVTKAEGAFDDSAVHNAYFLLFDGNTATTDDNRKLRVCKPAQVTDNTVEYSIGEELKDCDISDAIVCFLANVSKNFVEGNLIEGTTTWETFKNINMPITYASVANTGTVGVPTIDIETDGKTTSVFALPMFNWQKINTNDNEILLERLFARVELKLSLGIQDDGSVFTSEPQYGLLNCEVFNIPKYVPIVAKDGITEYSVNKGDSNYMQGELSAFNIEDDSDDDYNIIYYSDPPTYRSLYFYVPEHILGPIKDNTDQSLKPTLVSGSDKRAVYASLSSSIVGSDGESYTAVHNIYLGENETDNFDLKRNRNYLNYIRIKGVSKHDKGNIEEQTLDHRVVIDKMDDTIDGIDPQGVTSNCYIIEGDGNYFISAYRGAYKLPDPNAQMCDVGTNVVLACDNPNIIIEINHELSKQSTIVFKVSGITNTNIDLSPETGNAVIARLIPVTDAEGNPVYDENGEIKQEIDWSWHLWFIGNNEFSLGGDINLGTWTSDIVTKQTLPDGTTEMMDRNLGALSTTWNNGITAPHPGTLSGVYYRYGYKEPFFTGYEPVVDADNNVSYASTAVSKYYGGGESSEYSWNSTAKSPTDPCPYGYRVPPSSVWKGANDNSENRAHDPISNAFRYYNGSDYDIYYPYAGYLDEYNNKVNSNSQHNSKSTLNEAVLFPENQSYQLRKPSTNPIKYMSISYNTIDVDILGYFNTNNQNVLKYGYLEDGFEVESCERIEGTWVHVPRQLNPFKPDYNLTEYWYANYPNNESVKYSGEELKEKYSSHHDDIIDAIKDANDGSWWDQLVDAFNKTTVLEETAATSLKNGYQVRCVAE